MGHKHSKQQLLAGAMEAALEHGLSRLTFGRVASRMGTSDRVVVYYFPSKQALVSEVLLALGTELQAVVAKAFEPPATDHLMLARAAWPVLAHPQSDPAFRLMFEANGLAAAGIEPYRTVAVGLVEAWSAWLAELFEGTPSRRRAEADATIALVDGLLLLRQVAGPQVAERAAAALGVSG